jgi:hypothetical protein
MSYMRSLILITLLMLAGGCSKESVADRLFGKTSGDLVPAMMTCIANEGGYKPPADLPSIQAKWTQLSVKGCDMLTVSGDHISEIGNVLAAAFGAPDPRLGSIAVAPVRVLSGPHKGEPVGNMRMLMFGARQCGVVLTVEGDSKETKVLIMRESKR